MIDMNHILELRKETTAIILSYGDRPEFLEEVVSRLLELNVGRILVVANGVSNRTDQVVRRIVSSHHVVSRLDFPENRGSAGGYAGGIREALTHAGTRFIWLLDDDNLPAVDCLDKLFRAREDLSRDPNACGPLVLPVRPEQAGFEARLMAGDSWDKVKPRPSSFLGFHVFYLPRYLKRILTGKLGQLAALKRTAMLRSESIPVGLGSYGGMLLTRDIVEQAGLPDERFFIYWDDVEYTMRVGQCCDIYMIGDAVVHDLEPSWYSRTCVNQYVRALTAEDPVRIYYYVRNGVWMDRHVLTKSRLMYRLNRLCVRTILKYYQLKGTGTVERHCLIRRAIREGEADLLGRDECLGQD